MQLPKQKPTEPSKMSSVCPFCGETISTVQRNCICDSHYDLETSLQAGVSDERNVLKRNFINSNCEESAEEREAKTQYTFSREEQDSKEHQNDEDVEWEEKDGQSLADDDSESCGGTLKKCSQNSPKRFEKTSGETFSSE